MQDTIDLPQRDTEQERALGIVFNLSPAQASVLSCLLRARVVSSKELLGFIGTKSPIKVVVSRVRIRLKEKGMDVKSRMGVGYWLEPSDRDQINATLTDYMER